jgi:lycopene cyclase domain-containing protein
MKTIIEKIKSRHIIAIFFFLIIIFWIINSEETVDFQFNVENQFSLKLYNTHYLYLFIHLFSVVPVLLLSFDKKIAYHKKWKSVIPSILIVAILFITWDIFKTASQVWTFNPTYYLFKLINLPIEEWFFFLTFPFAAIFIHQCIHGYFSFSKYLIFEKKITNLIFFFLILLSFSFWDKIYTIVTSLFSIMVLLISCKNLNSQFRLNFFISFIFISLPFIITDLIWTGYFTESPIVIYNQYQFSNIRFLTIPIEDFIYNFSLILLILVVETKITKKMIAK